MKVLLGQLGSYGDCLFATVVARQIKKDFPGCELTWAVAAAYRSVVENNPYVDKIWELPMHGREAVESGWFMFEKEAREKRVQGAFDQVFLTQLSPGNLHRFDGGIRSSIFRGYPKAITVPIAPVVRLRKEEIERVKDFVVRNRLETRKHVVLFECAPKSGQSFVSPEFALAVAQAVVQRIPDISILLSSNIPAGAGEQIIDASCLSFRENAEVTKYCTLLLGCSSGITWLSTSDWSKPLPMIQFLDPEAIYPNSVTRDFKHFNLPVSNVIEITESSLSVARECIVTALEEGFAVARSKFHREVGRSFKATALIQESLLQSGDFVGVQKLIFTNLMRHGLRWPIFKLWCRGLWATRGVILDLVHRVRVASGLPRMWKKL